MITKRKIFLFGGCDLHDIAKNDLLQRDFDVIDYAIDKIAVDNGIPGFDRCSFPNIGTSVMSLYTNPGPIAQRVLETFAENQKRNLLLNRQVYNEIVKFPYIDFYRKYAGPDDYLLLGFSPEIYTKFRTKDECFTCVPPMDSLKDPDNILHWIYRDYFTKEDYLLPFDTKESLETSFDILVDFARDVYEIFQERVILVKTHFSNFVLCPDYKVRKIEPGPDHLMFYRQTKIMTDVTDHNYADRLAMIIMRKFMHHYSSDLKMIQLNEPVFIDGDHRWGYSQFHLDINSRTKLANMIYTDLSSRPCVHG